MTQRTTTRIKTTALATLACLLAATGSFAAGGGGGASVSGKLIVFHAGSLSVPFKQIAAAFTKENPDVRVALEAAGSRTCARKISDLQRPCDVMASADYTVIDALLVPAHADWNIRFASNEMTITYHDESRGSDRINRDNWVDVLMESKVAFGRADPNADPCGYRSVLTMKLAEKHYERPGLAARMLRKDLRCIRPKETDLLGLLEAGEIDYIFLYRSVAEQHGLKRLLLPDEVNLKTPKLAELYRTVEVELTGKKPGEKIVKRGAPMVYGVTIPKNAPNRAGALAFLEFLLRADGGMSVMRKNGQPSVVPAPSDTYEKIPERLKRFVRPAAR